MRNKTLSLEKLRLSTKLPPNFQTDSKLQLLKSNLFDKEIVKISNRQRDVSMQEQYIRGLQQQIKLLEYQLKLLKDKALNDQNKLSQYNNFMSDDLDINQNILAIKTKYVEERKRLNDRFEKAAHHNREQKLIAEGQRREIDRIKLGSSRLIQQEFNYENTVFNQFKELRQQHLKEKARIEQITERLKKFNASIKQTNEDIIKVQRAKEKDLVLQRKHKDEQSQQTGRFRSLVDSTKERLQSSVRQNYEVQKQFNSNHFVERSAESIALLKKRYSGIRSAKAALVERIEKVKGELEDLFKERKETEEYLHNLKSQTESCQLQQDRIQKNRQTLLQEQWAKFDFFQRRKSSLNELEHKRQKDLLFLLTQQFEEGCSGIIRQKDTLRLDIQSLSADIQKAHSEKSTLASQVLENSTLSGTLDELNLKLNQLSASKSVYIQSCKERVPGLQREIGQSKQRMQIYQKQMNLVKELRKLNLQEMKLITSGGTNLNTGLSHFIQKSNNILRQYKQ